MNQIEGFDSVACFDIIDVALRRSGEHPLDQQYHVTHLPPVRIPQSNKTVNAPPAWIVSDFMIVSNASNDGIAPSTSDNDDLFTVIGKRLIKAHEH